MRYKTRRRQVTSIQPTSITPSVASPTIIPSVATTQVMPVTITTPAEEALAAMTVLDPPEMVEQELSVPKSVLPIHPATNEKFSKDPH